MSSLRSILNPEENGHTSHRPEKATSNLDSPPSLSRSQSGTPNSPPPPSRQSTSGHSHSPHPDCPDTLDCLPDTDGRPQHTLPVILRCAILGSPKRRLTIRDIYAAMENKYPYYKTAGATWKQSVRHHLSLNRLFEREPRPVTEPGFGSYWTVNLQAPPGTKRPRKRGRPNKEETQAAQLKKRGRPRKNMSDAMDFEAELDHPPIATLPMQAAGSSSQAHRRSQRTALPSDSLGSDEDEASDAEDGEGRRLAGSDEENYYSDDDLQDTQSEYTPNNNRYTLVPTSGTLSDKHKFPNHNHFGQSDSIVEGLRNEIRDLRRQTSIASSVSARMSDQLAEAQADVAKFRFEKEVLEKRLENERQRRMQAEAALAHIQTSSQTSGT
ncbi:hypothetical protein BD410DRAFT_833861 [Rickenella mellea]|uniref:Fork-head domain-containing protein n=1 Tax=Rickenella mellea TaxID=50990 RepID=A0A4V3AZL6_9AGAM|nr:hypothetical protein BD410DRAFT_833861 [Rickenella mellea]